MRRRRADRVVGKLLGRARQRTSESGGGKTADRHRSGG